MANGLDKTFLDHTKFKYFKFSVNSTAVLLLSYCY